MTRRSGPTIFGALPKSMPRVVTIGRLDMNTEGLLLLTNDGGLARALELPATGWLRRYRVRAYGEVLQPRLDALRKGIEVDGVRYGAIEATLDRQQGDNSWITFAMREGKNREIRNVLGALGLKVNRLIRLSYGPFQLSELPAGAVEEVKTRALREQLGERLAAIAGADFSGPIVEREVEEEPTEKLSPRRPGARGAVRRAAPDDRGQVKPTAKGDGPDRAARESSKGTLRLPRDKERGRSSFEAGRAGLRTTGRESNRRTIVMAAGRHMATAGKNGQAAKTARIADTASRLATHTAARAAARPIAGAGADAHCRRQARRAHVAHAEIARHPADIGPPARGAVQRPAARLWRSGQRCPRARSLRRHRRDGLRGAVARRGLRAVRR